ncbi:disease resistance protein L6-like isoform X1 [Syzygium oleosum]|uniref:disease resistance protein L6-like isoform X1 n=1 Tax=Syzygium oleosum TaxID=219896 RepID=UPI0024B9DFFE|nr:disease resistance protein L6-like isoform X1 [Syzygium oleosum]
MKRKRDLRDAATTSACDDVGTSSGAEFEVFLSFRGLDTRLNFTDCLYHSLVGAGIRVFRDNEEIRKGEKIGGELLHAIKSAKILVPVFSRNYASSAWCLRELTHMVDCSSKANDKVILPIFYDVDPNDVKLKTRLYLDDLEKHEEKFGRDNVRRWKEALTQVARIKGWGLNDKGYGEIINTIVDEVFNKLKKRRRNMPDRLVGIHDHVEAIKDLLKKGSPDIHYLVIHGMGGIGKTTLASAVFNQISNGFEGCSFLLDVRESAQHGGIIDLQKQLLSDILQGRSLATHNSVDAGIDIISERFRNKKVLLILDDVDKWDQLSKLAGNSDWFGPGSKIIITTRDINFLPIKVKGEESSFQAHSEQFEIYEMTQMDSFHSLQLFSKHAFGMDFPPHDYDDISHKITRKTGGLPLALEVIGSSLFGKSKQFWKDTLRKLDLVPKQEVFNKLKISYDMLEHSQRDIFLDIACYFIGKERLHPYYMWKASNYFPKSEVIVLTRMSLIKIQENDTLWMHDQLRDLGREIIQREDVNIPGKRSRLWVPEIALDTVKMREGTNRVVALNLTGLSQVQNFTSEEFSKLPNLRFLELEGGNMVGDFKNLLSKLIWLSWSVCPSKLKATNLCLKKLAVLELSGSNITENWPGWGPCLVSENLKVIRITGCSRLKRIPDFSKCLNLKRLILQGCKALLVVDGSLSKLEHLKHMQINSQQLRLHQCDEFEQLPELPVSLKELKFSSHLLPTVPDFSYLTNLVHLHIWSDTPGLSEGALKIEWIKGLSNLERLTLVMRDVTFPLINWATLYQLRILEITCVDPQSMLGLPSSLEKLTLHDVNSPMERSLFCDLTNLSSLELCKCRLREVRFDDVLGQQLEKLHSLKVRDSELLERLSLRGLKGLQYLGLFNCPRLIKLEGVGELESLEELSLLGSKSLKKLTEPLALENLRRLCLIRSTAFDRLRSSTHESFDA